MTLNLRRHVTYLSPSAVFGGVPFSYLGFLHVGVPGVNDDPAWANTYILLWIPVESYVRMLSI